MGERNSNGAVKSREVCYDTLEQWARGKIQAQLQQLLEEEVATFLGRVRHERRGKVASVDPPNGPAPSEGHTKYSLAIILSLRPQPMLLDTRNITDIGQMHKQHMMPQQTEANPHGLSLSRHPCVRAPALRHRITMRRAWFTLL